MKYRFRVIDVEMEIYFYIERKMIKNIGYDFPFDLRNIIDNKMGVVQNDIRRNL